MKKILLIDSCAIFHKKKYNFVKGQIDNIIEDSFQEILKIVQQELPNIVVLCNDPTKSRYRTELLAGYKSGRVAQQKKHTEKEKQAEDLVRSLKTNLHLFEGLFVDGSNWGVEADDILGILFNDSRLSEYDIIVCSSDKDLMTVIPFHKIYDMNKGRYKTVEDCLGFNMSQWMSYQTVLGDSTDDIPKLKGVGKVTAFKLLDKYRSLKTLIESAPLDCKTEKDSLVRKALEQISTPEGKAQLKLTYSLVKIMKDVSLLNKTELNRYNDIVENILNFKLNEDIISEELDNYLLESNAFQASQILNEIKEYLR